MRKSNSKTSKTSRVRVKIRLTVRLAKAIGQTVDTNELE